MVANNKSKKLTIDELREQTMNRLNTVLDKYKKSNEKQGYHMAVINLTNVVEHIEKCYEFDMEFPSDE